MLRHLSHHIRSCADWERSLQAPAAKQAKQQAAQEDAGAVQGAGATAGVVGLALAKQVDQLASGVLLGIGRRLAQAQGQVPCCPIYCQRMAKLQKMDMAWHTCHTSFYVLSCYMCSEAVLGLLGSIMLCTTDH